MNNTAITRRNFMKGMGVMGSIIAAGTLFSACSGSAQNNSAGSGDAAQNIDGSAGGANVGANNTPNSNNESNANADSGGSNSASDNGKVLVAYYSAQGHTKRVAAAAADALGADIFEIVPASEYSEEDLDWTNPDSRVSQEHDNEDMREMELVQSTPTNWESYDMVLIGYPIWWGIAAWPCDKFVKSNNFEGKRVVPFATSSSSGMGQSGRLLQDMTNGGRWESGMRFASSATETEVQNWAASLR